MGFHEDFGKDVLEAVLDARGGRVELEHEVRGRRLRLDAAFWPAGEPAPQVPAVVAAMSAERCGFELASEAPRLEAVVRYGDKLFAWAVACSRNEPAGRRSLAGALAPLWVVAAGRPNLGLGRLEARPMPGLPEGVYEAAGLLPLRVVVVPELPRTRETVWLRLLGRGRVRAAAVADLTKLPHGSWQSRLLRSVLGRRRTRTAGWTLPDREEEAVMKNALQWYEDQARELRAEGRAEAKAEDVLAVLAARGLEVPEAVRERVQGCTDLGQLDEWLVRAAKVARADDIFQGPR